MRKLETNEDLFVDLCRYSPYGALSQGFIKVALETYCKAVLNSKKKWSKDSFINQEAWRGVAKDILDRMEAFYKREKVIDDGPISDEE